MRIVFALLLVTLFAACARGGSKKGGTSTDVGGGGSGIEALWRATANEVEGELRLLVVAPPDLDPADFAKIKAQLPSVFEHSTVRFVNYPLLYGQERADTDNPSHARFLNPADCFQVSSTTNGGVERDAINFPSIQTIKVSTPRFGCYNEGSEQIRRLVLHEYLGLLGFTEKDGDRTTYSMTASLINAFKLLHRFDDGLDVVMLETCSDLRKVGVSAELAGEGLETSVPNITYRLANNIDCTQEGPLQTKSLQANFDGNGYTLSGLTMTNGATALFGTLCSLCEIANLRVEGLLTSGSAGFILRNSGKISNVSFEGTLMATPDGVGDARALPEAGGFVRENFGRIFDVEANTKVLSPMTSTQVVNTEFAGFVATNRGLIARVKAVTEVAGSGSIAGFAGWNLGSIADSSVQLKMDGAGLMLASGFVDYNQGRLENIRADGEIHIVSSQIEIGPKADAIDESKVVTVRSALIVDNALSPKDKNGPVVLSQFGSEAVNIKSNVTICGMTTFTYLGAPTTPTSSLPVTSRSDTGVIQDACPDQIQAQP